MNTQVRHMLIVLLFLSHPGFGTSWTFSIDSQCTTINCNSGGTPIEGVWTATESSTGATFNNGTYTRPAPGFLKLTVPSGASAGTGSWKSTPPFSIFAIEAPSVGIIADTILSTETQPIIMVDSPTCASGNFSANFLAGQWSNNDMTSGSQMATGYLSWVNASNAFTISNLFNVTTFTNVLGGSFTMNGSACSSGRYDFVGAGDRGGSAWLGSKHSIIYSSNVGHTFYGLEDNSIPTGSALYGTYAALRYDSYSGSSSKILPMYVSINSAGSTVSSSAYSDPFSGTIASGGSALSETLTISAINSPRQGLLRGVLSGAHSGNIQCAAGLNMDNGAVNKNVLFCAGQSPSDSSGKSPFNLFMVSTKDSPGAVDKTFNGTGTFHVLLGDGTHSSPGNKVVGLTDGTFLVGSQTYTASGGLDFTATRITSTGIIDTTYGVAGTRSVAMNGGSSDYVRSMALQTDGKLVIAGTGNTANPIKVVALRFTTDGAKDTTFGLFSAATDTYNSANPTAPFVGVQTDGKILIGGNSSSDSSHTNGYLLRVTSNGALDTTFGTAGMATFTDGAVIKIYGGRLQSNGKVLLSGQNASGAVAYRLNSDGTLDTGFANVSTGLSTASAFYDVAAQADGKVVAAGTSQITANAGNFLVARFNTDGSLDTTFNSTGLTTTDFGLSRNDTAYGLILQPDGKIILGGTTFDGSLRSYQGIARYTSTGALDTTFNTTGYLKTSIGSGNDTINGIAQDPISGAIMAVGSTAGASYNELGVLRLWP